MRYADIATEKPNHEIQRGLKVAHLYTSIFIDICAILKILLPSHKALTVSNHLKSIMYALIELKTGVKPNKF